MLPQIRMRSRSPEGTFGLAMAERRSDRGEALREVRDRIPDVRDGLTRLERVILWQLDLTQKERRGRNVPTAMLYGRVVEHVDVSVPEFQRVLSRLVGGTK
jgi:hypothetical protein